MKGDFHKVLEPGQTQINKDPLSKNFTTKAFTCY